MNSAIYTKPIRDTGTTVFTVADEGQLVRNRRQIMWIVTDLSGIEIFTHDDYDVCLSFCANHGIDETHITEY